MKAERQISASAEQVWSVIADGWTYSQWVVGNSRMRAVDERWPAPNAVIEHSIGVWPLVINDRTIAETCRRYEEVVLLAKLGPFGAARITLRLFDNADGCRVEMEEVPVRGPMSLIPDRAAELAVYPRNVECLRRLAALAERRQSSELAPVSG
jgi:hypothetical protein